MTQTSESFKKNVQKKKFQSQEVKTYTGLLKCGVSAAGLSGIESLKIKSFKARKDCHRLSKTKFKARKSKCETGFRKFPTKKILRYEVKIVTGSPKCGVSAVALSGTESLSTFSSFQKGTSNSIDE